MKVKELIEALRNCPEDSEVHFTYRLGDYWHTQVAPKVRSVDRYGEIVTRSQHGDRLVEDDDQRLAYLDEGTEVRSVVVLR
jgi:hypothetical protein